MMTRVEGKLMLGWLVRGLLLAVVIGQLVFAPGLARAATEVGEQATPAGNVRPATNGTQSSSDKAQPAANGNGSSENNKSKNGSIVAPWEAYMPQPSEGELKGEEVPQKERQLVYSVSPWTAAENEPYGGTFVPKSEKTFYLLADHPSLVNPVYVEVSYWPIAEQYTADWFGYREDVPGKLEILQNGKVIATLDKVKCVFSYGENWSNAPTLLVGDEAVKAYQAYSNIVDTHYKAMTKYYEDYDAWNQYMDKLIKQVEETGKPAKPEEIPESPKMPEAPKLYVTESTEAFLVNLPAGEYEIRTIESGEIVPNSVKKLVVVAPRRKGIGYVVVPDSQRARPFTSDDQSQPFYTWGATLYVGVFDSVEYDQYAYTRLTQAHVPSAGKGMENKWQWVYTKERTDVRMQLIKNGEVIEELVRQPFYVTQNIDYALGYWIIPFNENDPAMQGQEPTLWGFRVVVPENLGGRSYQLRVVDAKGNVLTESVRDIHLLPTALRKLLELAPNFHEEDMLRFWRIVSGADSRHIVYTKDVLIELLQLSSMFLLASTSVGVSFSELESLGYDAEWISLYAPPSGYIAVDLWIAIQEHALTLTHIPGAEMKALGLAKKYWGDASPSGQRITNELAIKWFIRLQEMKQAGLLNE